MLQMLMLQLLLHLLHLQVGLMIRGMVDVSRQRHGVDDAFHVLAAGLISTDAAFVGGTTANADVSHAPVRQRVKTRAVEKIRRREGVRVSGRRSPLMKRGRSRQRRRIAGAADTTFVGATTAASIPATAAATAAATQGRRRR